jgi:hypothetical protein
VFVGYLQSGEHTGSAGHEGKAALKATISKMIAGQECILSEHGRQRVVPEAFEMLGFPPLSGEKHRA